MVQRRPIISESSGEQVLEAALAVRQPLLADPQTTAWRVFNDAADGISGLVIEKLGDVLVVQRHEQRLRLTEPALRGLCEATQRRLGASAMYQKVFPRERSAALPQLDRRHHDPQPWLGVPAEPEFAVLEHGIRYLVRAYDGYSTGLFLEQRELRRRVRELADGRRVLNAFAYTCGFSVAAGLGGAAGTVSVDISKKSLEWGKRNFAANGLGLDGHTFICSEIFDYYRRARRQGRRFELVILDPPTFARARKPARTFALTADLDELVAGAVDFLEPQGVLVLCTNHRGTPHSRLEAAVARAAAACGRRWRVLDGPALPADFAGDPDYAKSIVVRVD